MSLEANGGSSTELDDAAVKTTSDLLLWVTDTWMTPGLEYLL